MRYKSGLPKTTTAAEFVDVKVGLRTERQKQAAALRAKRATRVLVRRPGGSWPFYANCWTVSVKTTAAPSGSCEAHGCGDPASRRIAINCHGCVYECDVCPKHAERHGKWVDSL